MKITLLFLISMSLSAFDITGTWKLNSKHPHNFAGIISYGGTFFLSSDGTVIAIQNNKTVTGTTRKYQLHNSELNIYLENKQEGVVRNFFLKHSSANQTFKLQQIDDKCLLAIQQEQKTNTFTMCKE